MGDERDQSTKLKQAIDILSSICSGSTSGTTSGDNSGGSSASRSSSQRRPDRSRTREAGSNISNACSQAATALRSVREQLQRRDDSDNRREAAELEQHANFAPYLSGSKKRRKGSRFHSFPPSKKGKRQTWSPKFVCLANKNQCKVPCTVDEKEKLVNAGLGERAICIPDIECSSLEFRQTLIDEFPKLESAGGFELMRCIPNTRQLEPISSTVSQQPKLLKSVVANGRIYIRPIQKDLDLSPVGDMDEEVTERCLTCDKQMPLKELRKHVQSCSYSVKVSDLSSDSDFEYSDSPFYDRSPIYIPSDEEEVKHKETSRCRDITSGSGPSGTRQTSSHDPPSLAGGQEDQSLSLDLGSPAKEPVSLTEVIGNLSLCMTEGITRFVVRRGHVLEDALRATSRKNFDPNKQLKVNFLGEESADGGGPRREFWTILGKEIKHSFFEGKENRLVLRHDSVALVDKKYHQVGQLMAMAVVQGGSGFHFLAPCVYQYLCGVDVSAIPVSTDDIPDYEVTTVVQKICDANDEKELRSISVDAVDMSIAAGFSKPVSLMKMDDREELLHIISLHYTLLRSKAELDQLKVGLEALGVKDAMKVYPDLFESFFTEVGIKPLTADELQKMLEDVRFSQKGTTEREKEEATYMFFLDLLHSCEDGTAPHLLSLEKVLNFFTGSEVVPPQGFDPKPTLRFNSENMFPTASTCALELCLPTRYYNDYTTFSEKLTLGFTSHGGFGLV